MKEIDVTTWDRAMHCQIFRNSVQLQYCVTFELDITNFLKKTRERGYSFTFSFVFAVTKCDIYQFSSFPWASFTHISHTESGRKDNAVPMIDWGKYFIRDDRVLLPFSVQVHHSFVDGVHIGKLAGSLQEYLERFA